MCSVSRAFRSSCSGWGRPRSAKTFPLLFSTLTGFLVLVVMLVLPFSVEPFGLSTAARVQLPGDCELYGIIAAQETAPGEVHRLRHHGGTEVDDLIGYGKILAKVVQRSGEGWR